MKQHIIDDSPLAKFLFRHPRAGWIWLIPRLYVGYEWFMAGWTKIHTPVWVGTTAGGPVAGFVNGALQKTAGLHPDVQGWYGYFLEHFVLPHATLWANLVAYGEVLVGIALILGIFTGIAAFFGLFMNLNYLLAGTVSTNPILFTISIGLILAWKVAGYIGLDRFILPLVGTPWKTNEYTDVK